MAERLVKGDTAPGFTAEDQSGASVSLSDFFGRKVIIYFYPEAMTPGCTTQACDFQDSLASLQSAGYAVVGISRDAPNKLARFAGQDHLTFPLLSDPERIIHDAYSTWGEKNLYGKKVTGVLRSTFVIDETGTITLAQYNAKATGHVASLRKKLDIG